MRIYDPEQCHYVDLADCFQLTEIDGWTPTVANEDVGWFVVDMQTNQSCKPELLEEETLKKVTLAVGAHSLSESLLGRLHVLSEDERLDHHLGVNWRNPQALMGEGALPIRVAMAKAQAEGYNLDQIRFALNAFDEFPGDAFQTFGGLDESEIQSLAEGVEDKHILKAIFVMGAGASGKSKVGDEMFSGLGMKFINQDKHLTRFFKEADLALSQIGSDYGLFKKAQALGRKELKHYAQQRLGLVIDMTGWDFKRIERPVNRLRALGYDCYAVLVHASLEKSKKRNMDRERKVPDYYVATAHRGLWSNFPRYSRLFGKAQTFLIRNEDDIEQDVWDREIGPKLRAAALRILAKPVKNKNGLKWIAKALQAKGVQPQIEAEVFPAHLPFTEETLDEVLDKPYKLKLTGTTRRFHAVADIPGASGEDIEFSFLAQQHPNDKWELALWIGGKTEDLKNAADPAKVMSTIFDAVKRFIKKHDPNSFHILDFHRSKEKLWKVFTKMVGRLGYDDMGQGVYIPYQYGVRKYDQPHKQDFMKRGSAKLAASDDHYDDLTEVLDKPYPLPKFKQSSDKIGRKWEAKMMVPGKDGKDVAFLWRASDTTKSLMGRNLENPFISNMKGPWEVAFWLDKQADVALAPKVENPTKVLSTVIALTKAWLKRVKPTQWHIIGNKMDKVHLFRMVHMAMRGSGWTTIVAEPIHGHYTMSFLRDDFIAKIDAEGIAADRKKREMAGAASESFDEQVLASFRKGTVDFPKTNATFLVELAETPEQIARGMMFRESLPVDSGMLFLMPERGQHSMFMRNTHLPLDMVFIDEDKIVHIEENTTPYSEEVRTNETPASMVLEVNAGTVRDYSMVVGDAVVVTQWDAQKVHSDDKQTTR